MHEQVAARRRARRPRGSVAATPGGAGETARTGVVAVASGVGLTRLFGSEGALVVDGGSTLNPSIEEILAGIREAPGEEVIVLPNSPNVVMAAKEAARLAERPAHVVSSVAQQAGLAALVGAYDAAAAPPTTPAGSRPSSRRSRPASSPRPIATTPKAATAAATRSGSAATSWSPGATRPRRCGRSSPASAGARDRHRDRGRRRPASRARELELGAGRGRGRGHGRRASPPTGGSSPPNESRSFGTYRCRTTTRRCDGRWPYKDVDHERRAPPPGAHMAVALGPDTRQGQDLPGARAERRNHRRLDRDHRRARGGLPGPAALSG